MDFTYKDYAIHIVDDSNYTSNPADNIASYVFEYGEAITGSLYPTSKHGLRITRSGKELASAIIRESGGATTIHDHSAVIKNESIRCSELQMEHHQLQSLEIKCTYETGKVLSIYLMNMDTK